MSINLDLNNKEESNNAIVSALAEACETIPKRENISPCNEKLKKQIHETNKKLNETEDTK